MLLRTGGGSLDLGRHGGIHWWHIYSDNRIRYLARRRRGRRSSWVELIDARRRASGSTPGPGEEAPARTTVEREARVMDCIDCHNRPTHLFQFPAKAVDDRSSSRAGAASRCPSSSARRWPPSRPTTRPTPPGVAGVREAVARLLPHASTRSGRRPPLVERGADAAAEVYARTVFPEMKTNWETHPNHIGHEDVAGLLALPRRRPGDRRRQARHPAGLRQLPRRSWSRTARNAPTWWRW